jgi:hypothetical protein
VSIEDGVRSTDTEAITERPPQSSKPGRFTAEVVCYDDPVIITERVVVAALIAGYTDPTCRSYARTRVRCPPASQGGGDVSRDSAIQEW